MFVGIEIDFSEKVIIRDIARDCFIPESGSGQAVPPRNDIVLLDRNKRETKIRHCEERSNLIHYTGPILTSSVILYVKSFLRQPVDHDDELLTLHYFIRAEFYTVSSLTKTG